MTLFYIDELFDSDFATDPWISPWFAVTYALQPTWHKNRPEDMLVVLALNWLNEHGVNYVAHAGNMSFNVRTEDGSLEMFWSFFVEIPVDSDAALFRFAFPDHAVTDPSGVVWDDIWLTKSNKGA